MEIDREHIDRDQIDGNKLEHCNYIIFLEEGLYQKLGYLAYVNIEHLVVPANIVLVPLQVV